MTKKDYKKIANRLRLKHPGMLGIYPTKNFIVAQETFDMLIGELCIIFKEDNPKFNSEKFLNAVNWKGEE